MISSTTQEIAQETNEIAIQIVKNSDEKEFEGKNSIKAVKTAKTNNSKNESVISNHKEAKTSTKIVEKKSNKQEDKDEWESF
uniref:hypothetical protein n=1 Tax=Aliarcobacter sp. TaxID=2321116 RepID=UPI0040481224